jgi:hypothetical protein
MRLRITPSSGALASVAVALVALGAVSVAGQTKAAAGKTWTPARTADGQPDLQGMWNYATITPLERPSELAGKETFTDEEATEFERKAATAINRDRRDSAGRPEKAVNGTSETADLARAYNDFWWDSGTKVVGTKRTSLVVDPADGRVPALTPAAQKLAKARDEIRARPAWGPEDRPAGERCIHQQRTGPPINPGGYNNNLQLLQSPGYVSIVTEQIHDVRIIPLDGRAHIDPSIRQWKGDSRGHWEGNTLVVDTVNFNSVMAYQNSGPNMHLTERFTRKGPDEILYEYTVSDPESFQKPWTVQMSMTKNPSDFVMYEYACHEGNYGIVGSLSGARFVEKAAAQAGKTGSK